MPFAHYHCLDCGRCRLTTDQVGNMRTLPSGQKLLLTAAALVPIVYFGAQALAAPYFPNYSVFTTTASELGSNLSSRPSILNTGALLTGLLALLGSVGLAMSLPRLGADKIAAFLLAICLASAGLAALWAGLHPLPDPRHNPGALGAGMFASPFVALWAAWRMQSATLLRLVLSLNAIAFAVLAAIMSGAAGVDLSTIGGLVQKLLAATSFGSGAIVAGAAVWQSRQRSALP